MIWGDHISRRKRRPSLGPSSASSSCGRYGEIWGDHLSLCPSSASSSCGRYGEIWGRRLSAAPTCAQAAFWLLECVICPSLLPISPGGLLAARVRHRAAAAVVLHGAADWRARRHAHARRSRGVAPAAARAAAAPRVARPRPLPRLDTVAHARLCHRAALRDGAAAPLGHRRVAGANGAARETPCMDVGAARVGPHP